MHGARNADALRGRASAVKSSQDVRRTREGNGLDYAGVKIAIGKAWVDPQALEGLAFSRFVIAPQPTRRGTNGLWGIRRGPNHPLNLAGADIGAYLLTTEVGHPHLEIRTRNWHTGHVLSLFDTLAGIERAIARNQAQAQGHHHAPGGVPSSWTPCRTPTFSR